MREMIVNGIHIDDTFAEAFDMRATGVVITADSARWAHQAAVTMIGFGTSVIGCGCEAGIDRELSPRETPDAPTRHSCASVRRLHQRIAEATAEPGWPMRADRAGLCLLRGISG